ncbi:hypothetical protein [Micromonospora sp. HUAS LYJ1]|uniref:hypothetical protein n=1 Tax=Micromonospora sp. HUAS LYJ1 TaxID=3061626 RepID=UPI002670ED05|nr:hypothetical protein [Micromonospora sp. HUAS LYJ1]WKU02535.1 hypothetical protein Q2K16_16535 [Micromonospora sp. HUAS LYJ1]
MSSKLATVLLSVALMAAPTLTPPASASAAPGALTSYRMVDLGTFGGDSSYANAMNDRGDVIGRAQDTSGVYQGFLWQRGRMINLGAFNPIDVNDRGEVVGARDDGSGAYIWHRGIFRPLGGRYIRPVAINDRSQVLGYAAAGPVLWTDGRTQLLPLNDVSDVNDRGHVSGGISLPPDGFHATLWHGGRTTDLGAGPFNRSNTYGLNDSGWVIGWQFSADQSPRGILWRHGRTLDIGTLGGSFTEPRAINNRGEILAISATTDQHARPALWRRGVMHDLSLAGVSTEGSVVDLDDRGGIAATIRPVWGIARAVVYRPR